MRLNRVGGGYARVLCVTALFLSACAAVFGNTPTFQTNINTDSDALALESTPPEPAPTTTVNPGAQRSSKKSAQVRWQLPDPDLVRQQEGKKVRPSKVRTVRASRTIARAAERSPQSGVIPPAPDIVKRTGVEIGSSFGYRSDPFTKQTRFHSGIDIKAPRGTRVGASHPGTVVFAGWDRGYGNLVIVDHGGEVFTYYAHLSSFNVRVGDKVARGTNVGQAGSTGRATSAHLHYELRLGENAVNPLQTLALDPTSNYFSEQAAAKSSVESTPVPLSVRQAAKEAPRIDAGVDGNAGTRRLAVSFSPTVTRPPLLKPVDYQGSLTAIGYADRYASTASLHFDPPNDAPVPSEMNRPRRSDQQNLNVSSQVSGGKALARSVPDYPAQARILRIEGTVQVAVDVAADGRVLSARAVSGPPLLHADAIKAARAWRFQPVLSNGVPVRITRVISFVFKLRD